MLGRRGSAVNRVQTLARVFDVGAQWHDGHRDLIAFIAPLLLAARAQGHHRVQAGRGQLALQFEVLAQGTAGRCDEDVVDRDAGDVLANPRAVFQRKPHRIDHAMGGDLGVEAGMRRQMQCFVFRPGLPGWRTGRAQLANGPLAGVERLATDDGIDAGRRCALAEIDDQAGAIQQLAGPVVDRACAEFDLGRVAIGNDRNPVVQRVVFWIQRRRQRMDGADDFDPRLAVDRSMVELDVEGEAFRGDSRHVVEPLDDVGLPQRLRFVQRT